MTEPSTIDFAAHAEHINKFDGYRGNIIGLWACVESAMDRANHYAWYYTDKDVAEKVPVSLGRKIKLFKEIHRDIAPFEPLKERAVALIGAVDSLFEDRHWLAHGYLDARNPKEGVWLVGKHVFPKESGDLETVERSFTEGELEAFRLKLIILAHEFSGYLKTLADQISKHPRDEKAS